jgi:hypothetical protein
MTRGKTIKKEAKKEAKKEVIRELRRDVRKTQPKRRANAPQTRPHNARNDFAELRAMLGSRPKQEVAYLRSLAKPWSRYKARLPVTMDTGLVPVDLFTVEVYSSMVANSSGASFITYEPDGWYEDQFLGEDGATGKPISKTSSGYVGDTSPAIGSVATGVGMISLPDVSADIAVDSDDGTEYALVSTGIAVAPQEAADADGFRGLLHVITTKDPERYPLTGLSVASLRTAANVPGSQYTFRTYRFTRDGLLVPKKIAIMNVDGTVLNTGGVPSVGQSCIPITREGFSWHQCTGTPTATIAAPSVLIAQEYAPENQRVSLDVIWNYQLEQFPTNRVTGGGQAGIPAPSNAADLLSNASSLDSIMDAAGLHDGNLGTIEHIAAWLKTQIGNNPGLLPQLAAGGGQLLKSWFGEKEGGMAVNMLPHIAEAASSTRPAVEVWEGTSWVPLVESGLEEAAEFLPLLAL